MKVRVLVPLLLLLSATPMRAGARLSLSVSPSVAFEPADMTIKAVVENNQENRTIEIVAESHDFYRRSIMPLNGESAPRVTMVSYRSMPSGEYLVRVVVRGSMGQELAFSEKMARIVDRDGEL